MVVDVIACQGGDTLAQILDTPASEEQVGYLSRVVVTYSVTVQCVFLSFIRN